MTIGSLILFGILVSASNAGSSPSATPGQSVATSASNDATVIKQRVKEGQRVRITDDKGQEWQGRIGEVGQDTLVLVTKERQRQDVGYGTILRIDRPHDGLGDGAVIGFLSGAIVGLLAVLSEETA